MRRILALLFFIPLAACFDADISISFPDSDTASMNAVMTMAPEFYAMASASGEDLCEGGAGEMLGDGGYTCTITETKPIDELIEEMKAEENAESASPSAMANGFIIERLEGNQLRVSFDVAAMTDGMDEQPEDLGDMEEMLRAAFEGHEINISVTGAEIIDTNGEISEDGKTASFSIPLTKMLDEVTDLPKSFDVTLSTGR